MEHPAVFSIGSADARFVFEDFSGRETRSPLGHNSIQFFRVNESGPIPTGDFVQSHAEVFQPRLVEVIEVAVRPGCVYQRGNGIDEKLNIQQLGFWSRGGHRGHYILFSFFRILHRIFVQTTRGHCRVVWRGTVDICAVESMLTLARGLGYTLRLTKLNLFKQIRTRETWGHELLLINP